MDVPQRFVPQRLPFDKGYKKRKENSKFHGPHYVDCYIIIKNGVCVARERIDVPISTEGSN